MWLVGLCKVLCYGLLSFFFSPPEKKGGKENGILQWSFKGIFRIVFFLNPIVTQA